MIRYEHYSAGAAEIHLDKGRPFMRRRTQDGPLKQPPSSRLGPGRLRACRLLAAEIGFVEQRAVLDGLRAFDGPVLRQALRQRNAALDHEHSDVASRVNARQESGLTAR